MGEEGEAIENAEGGGRAKWATAGIDWIVAHFSSLRSLLLLTVYNVYITVTCWVKIHTSEEEEQNPLSLAVSSFPFYFFFRFHLSFKKKEDFFFPLSLTGFPTNTHLSWSLGNHLCPRANKLGVLKKCLREKKLIGPTFRMRIMVFVRILEFLFSFPSDLVSFFFFHFYLFLRFFLCGATAFS